MLYNDESEYLEYTRKGVLGKLTRGVVMSVSDPLFSGRVKVWIPTLHGGFPMDNSGEELEGESDSGLSNSASLPIPLPNSSFEAKEAAISLLPWASVLNVNWGASLNPENGLIKSKSLGVFNVPKIGTEVWVIFEDDDPNSPVIIGAVNHEADLLLNEAANPTELGAGLPIFNFANANEATNTYPETVSESYVIQGERGSYFVLSDAASKQQIKLGGTLQFTSTTALSSILEGEYKRFSDQYPNFPSTATAPFKRTSLPGGESAKTVAESVPANTDSTEAVPPTKPSNSPYTKSLPVKASYPKVTGGKKLWAPRGASLHIGIDLAVPVNTPLYAPIDGKIYYVADSVTAGTMLFMQGADGYCHAFLHLNSILPTIRASILKSNPPNYPSVKCGDLIGYTGNTGTNSQGPHLHWEVFYHPNIRISSYNTIENFRNVGKRGGTMQGQAISRYSVFVDGQEWVRNNSNIIIPPNQIPTLHEALTDSTEQSKVIGLEMSLVPGAETVFLRHPSGAFLGFDADGNFKLYTPGDAHFKVNRSMIYDVLGGIMTTCLAMYNRVTSVYRMFAGMYRGVTSFYYNPDDFPEEFKTIETTRSADMIDSLNAISSNFYCSLSSQTLAKSLKEIATTDGGMYADTSSFNMANFTVPIKAEYDGLITSKFNEIMAKYSESSNIGILKKAGVLTADLIKAIVLVESNGDPTAKSTRDAVGLMQITLPAIKQIRSNAPMTNSYLNTMLDPKENLDVGIQYFLYCCDTVMKHTARIYKKFNRSYEFDTSQAKDIIKIALLTYNAGEGAALLNYETLLINDTIPCYLSIEKDYYTRKSKPGEALEALNYAPKVLFVYKNITKTG